MYSNIIWSNCPGYLTNRIFMLQKKAVRLICNTSYLAHTSPLFTELKLLPIEKLIKLQLAIFMYSWSNNLLPKIFDELFIYNREIHQYPTRRRENIHIGPVRTSLVQKSFLHEGPKLWNELPLHIRSLPTLNSFKNQIKKMLLS